MEQSEKLNLSESKLSELATELNLTIPEAKEMLDRLKSNYVNCELEFPSFNFGGDYEQLMRTLLVFCDKHLFKDIHVIQAIIEKSKPTESSEIFLKKINFPGDFNDAKKDQHFYGNSLFLTTMDLPIPLFSQYIINKYSKEVLESDFISENYIEISQNYTDNINSLLEEILDLDEIETNFSQSYEDDSQKFKEIKENSLQNTLPFFLAPPEKRKFMFVPTHLAFSGAIPQLNVIDQNSILGLFDVSIHDHEQISFYDGILMSEYTGKFVEIICTFIPKIHFEAFAYNFEYGKTHENYDPDYIQKQSFEIINQFTAIFKSLIEPKVLFFRTPLTHLEEVVYGFIDFNSISGYELEKEIISEENKD